MKTALMLILLLLTGSSALVGQSTGNSFIDVILSSYSQRNLITEPVTDQQLDLILKCGIKAPSARNLQPWKFTVVRDEASVKEIIPAALPGNVLIIISGVETQGGGTPDFDCGLATESMFLATQGLGLGARIYGSPVGNINSKREAFQIPSGYKAVTVLRIGNIDKSVDAVSAASARKKPEEIVNFKK